MLLEGPTGCGKTALITEIARLGGKECDLLKVHLGGQTDAKALLGTYVCGQAPGEFYWQPGVLAQAVVCVECVECVWVCGDWVC